ncbi:metallophosphoesterase 1 homolog isoform X2 [Stomoxys calcitrans]|uniref:Metallophosphoesterase 1 homolog n=1 Tax=Stomoxys calcitrans TaxID=35570 RepID=A0A1I8NWD2_STOCA|nr:metallophosphoesterase 1 homolog isoform X2 [Stomoxys calcitrans]
MQWRRCIFIIISSFIYCEFIGDFVKIAPCHWPLLDEAEDLHAMIIADTHLLGPLKGHWLDKLYREWHMRRAFQAAILLHKPDVIFVLGDLFDEGDMVDHVEFSEYVRRFNSHFHASVPVISAVGNHDVGFHYKMHPYFIDRFREQFNNTGVEMYTIHDNHFILINSMAMENDACVFCANAVKELQNVAGKLNCLKRPEACEDLHTLQKHKKYSRPIILQHFPTYRNSDVSCREHDSPIIEEYREKWEVLSKNSTDWLGKILHPRLAFAGHSHNYCFSINRWGIEEYTVASFSWRNKINPSFLMVSLKPESHKVYKCQMLEQQTVYTLYAITSILCAFLIAWGLLKWIYSLFGKSKGDIKIQ